MPTAGGAMCLKCKSFRYNQYKNGEERPAFYSRYKWLYPVRK